MGLFVQNGGWQGVPDFDRCMWERAEDAFQYIFDLLYFSLKRVSCVPYYNAHLQVVILDNDRSLS